jgi:F-type H+-transporting ATPase subunit b
VRRVALVLLLSAALFGASEGDGHHDDNSTLWKTANFVILVGLLGYGISKAAGPFFNGRTEEIQRALVESRKLKEDADGRAAEIDAKLANLATEIENLKAEARQEMAAEGERVKAETARMLAKIKQQARQEIESAEKQAIKELRAHAAELAVDLARQKIQSRMTPASEGILADQFIARLAKSQESPN